MAESGEPKGLSRICPTCHVGHIVRRRITHAAWHEAELIVMPNVHAEVCDYCGETNLEDDQVWRLDQLLRYGTELGSFSHKSHNRSVM